MEGCIAKCYILEEAIIHYMEYMLEGNKGSHKRGREDFMDDDDECAGKQSLGKKVENIELDNLQYEQVRRYVLDNYDGVDEWKRYTC